MKLVLAFTILCVMYMVGCWVSKKTKGIISGALFCAAVFLIAFWTGLFPKDIVEISGLKSVYSIMSALIIVNMGTTLEIQQFKQYWRVVVVALAACALMTVVTLTLSRLIVGRDLALASFPILMGAVRATQIMSDALNEKGLVLLAAIITLVNVTQQFFGLPMVSIGVRKAALRMLADYRNGVGTEIVVEQKVGKKPELIEKMPKQYQNPFVHLASLGVLGVIAAYAGAETSKFTGGIVGMPVIALIVGFAFRQFGLVVNNPMQKSGTMPFFMFATIVVMFGNNLSNLSLADFAANIVPILVLLVLGAVGLTVGGYFTGKLLKIDPGVAVGVAFGAYTGYPLNFQVAQDTIGSATEDEKERAYLEAKIIPSICLGSIVSVTITSIIVAGAVANLL